MDNINKDNKYDDLLQESNLAMETPVGWSSICFDQTIDYYIECNSITLSYNDNKKPLEN